MQLQIFQYQESGGINNVRTVEIDGEIWFIGGDVAAVLGYANTRKAVRDHCKHYKPIGGNESFPLDPQTLIIPESDVYRMIIKSQLPRAEKFENWIFGEVIPTIRKTGRFGVTPIFVRRFNDNWDRVDRGYFSIISELFIRVYGKLEQAGHLIPDKAPDGKEIRPDVSVGKTFPLWLESKYPDKVKKFKTYKHLLPNGLEVDARQYKNDILPYFIEYVENDWMYNRAKAYFEPRDPVAINYLPKLLDGGTQPARELNKFDKELKGILNVPPEGK